MVITSAANPKIKHIRGLIAQRKYRTRHRQFFVEGVRAINSVYQYNWQVDMLIYDPEQALSDWARDIIARTGERTRVEVNEYLMGRISQREETSELAAVVVQPEDNLARVPVSDRLLAALADRPSSPGNLGSLIRSCDALGADALLIAGHAVDLYAPRTVRASMGSLFALPVIRLDSLEMLEAWVAGVRSQLGRLQMVGSSAHARKTLFEHDLTGPTLLVLGNEMEGMSYRLSQMCDVDLTIPISGSASSLNVTAAASILLYEVKRQRMIAATGIRNKE